VCFSSASLFEYPTMPATKRTIDKLKKVMSAIFMYLRGICIGLLTAIKLKHSCLKTFQQNVYFYKSIRCKMFTRVVLQMLILKFALIPEMINNKW